MTDDKVISLFAAYSDKIPSEKQILFKSALKKADDSAYENLAAVSTKSATTTVLLSIFLGWLGIDRFYIGDTGLGVAKLLLGWMTAGIWPFIDIFFSYKKAKEKNLQALLMALS